MPNTSRGRFDRQLIGLFTIDLRRCPINAQFVHDEVRAQLDEYQRAGYELGITAQCALLCPALLLRDEPELALEVIEHGLSIASHNGERLFEAELYRLKARVLLARGAPDAEAQALLEQALQTARSQQARSIELRAASQK
jgi:hypothetical protein